MSKIETALSKARGQLIRIDSARAPAPSKEIVALEQRAVVSREAERAAVAKALARMEESWLLTPQELAKRRIVNIENAPLESVMTFRELRTKIMQLTQKNCAILVSSVTKAGDSAFVASNLAASFAFDDSKTAVLLDCCLANPLFGHLAPTEGLPGVTDYLKDEKLRVEQILHPVGIRRLRLVPAGNRHDRMADYFTSTKMRELMEELRGRYPDRYLVMGAPPVTESADAHILMDLADYVVLVVPYGRVTEGDIADTLKLVGNKKLLGILFSDVPALPRERFRLSTWLGGLLGLQSRSLQPRRQ